MQDYYVDLHIHIGRALGKPVKITAANSLTFHNIMEECVNRKGIQVIGIVDCGSPLVQQEIEELLRSGLLVELAGGGYRYKEQVVVILGSEVETTEVNGGDTHCVCYFPTLNLIKAFTEVMTKYIKNVTLSSQKGRLTLNKLIEIVATIGGEIIPAHVFTPHKSVYGNCTDRLAKLIDEQWFKRIAAVELGLSSDSDFADHIAELTEKAFVTNSDAHSLGKIGREYNVFRMEEANYQEIFLALRRIDGRRVVANYGLDPKLGKYHRTHCLVCDQITTEEPPIKRCPACGSDKTVMGVYDRIVEIADYPEAQHPEHRPNYNYQVPLQFLPKVGPKTIDKLLNSFGTEMEVLHRAEDEKIKELVGEEIGNLIIKARRGQIQMDVGGGGRYGRIIKGDK